MLLTDCRAESSRIPHSDTAPPHAIIFGPFDKAHLSVHPPCLSGRQSVRFLRCCSAERRPPKQPGLRSGSLDCWLFPVLLTDNSCELCGAPYQISFQTLYRQRKHALKAHESASLVLHRSWSTGGPNPFWAQRAPETHHPRGCTLKKAVTTRLPLRHWSESTQRKSWNSLFKSNLLQVSRWAIEICRPCKRSHSSLCHALSRINLAH